MEKEHSGISGGTKKSAKESEGLSQANNNRESANRKATVRMKG